MSHITKQQSYKTMDVPMYIVPIYGGRAEGRESALVTDKQNHGQDVTTIGAAIDRHGTPLHETPC